MTEAVGRSDAGRHRSSNEDAFLADATLDLLLVADGMGGHLAGEVASRLAVETVAGFVKSSGTDSQITWPYGLDTQQAFEANQLRNAIQLANQRIFVEGRKQASRSGMGSTLVAALLRAGTLFHASVGDSRLYRFRHGALDQLTKDDSWAATMLKAGADPAMVKAHPMRHMLTSALGSENGINVRIAHEPVQRGDLLLLCTDGLHGPLAEPAIVDALGGADEPLAVLADRLIERANEAGGPDNVTVVLARVEPRPEPGAPRWNG